MLHKIVQNVANFLYKKNTLFIYPSVHKLSSVRFSIAMEYVYSLTGWCLFFLAQTKPVLRIDAKSKYLSCRILGSHIVQQNGGFTTFYPDFPSIYFMTRTVHSVQCILLLQLRLRVAI